MGTQKAWVLALKFRTLKQPCKMWPGRAASAAGLLCRRGPCPAHQSSCPGALASRARCWLPGAPSFGSFIRIIVSNLLMQAACKYKERSNLGSHEIHLSTPACCLLPAFQEEMRQLCCWTSASPLHVFVIGASSSRTQILLAVLLRQSTCSFPAERLHSPRLLFLWTVETLLSFSALLGKLLGTS